MSSFTGRGGRTNSGGRESGRGRSDTGRGRGGRESGGGRGESAGGRADFAAGRGGRGDFGGGRGGDRGDFGGGRGGGRDSGAPSGRNKHMGEVGTVLAKLSATGMSDREILSVINPPASQRNRLEDVNRDGARLPGHSPWRMQLPIGSVMAGDQVVRANHFRLNTDTIPRALYKYHVHIYKMINNVVSDEVSHSEDYRISYNLLQRLKTKHPEWNFGYAYDGRSGLVTTADLRLGSRNKHNQAFHEEIVGIDDVSGGESTKKKYTVSLTHTDTLYVPEPDSDDWKALDPTLVAALDIALLGFARWELAKDSPQWFISGQRLFASSTKEFELKGAIVAKRGIYSSIKSVLAGAVLVADMSANFFLCGGPMLDVMARAAEYARVSDLVQDCTAPGGLRKRTIDQINEFIKGAKVKLIHIGHGKRAHSLGPASDSHESEFEIEDANGRKVKMTVSQYFERMAREKPEYRAKLGKDGKLKYPKLPTINVGSASRPVLVPVELVHVLPGQIKNNIRSPDLVSKMIRYSAVRPDERFQTITHGDNAPSIVQTLRTEPSVQAFGLHNVDPTPMQVTAALLPPARLLYGSNAIVEPRLEGGWNIDRPQRKFLRVPPNSATAGCKYGILVVSPTGPPAADWLEKIAEFAKSIERDANGSGLKLVSGGPPLTSNDLHANILAAVQKMRPSVKLIMVVLNGDVYGKVKIVTDTLGIISQCVKWKNIEKTPRGFHLNVVMKINTKLGGVNHSLASRLPTNTTLGQQFQEPPASIGWHFEKPAMLIGIDVSHPDPGSDKPSMAAVVGSMDGRLSQYAAHITSQTRRQEMVSALEDAVFSLLQLFKTKNGNRMPEKIIVYRDGVSEGQFNAVLEQELPQLQGAVARMGYNSDQVKISIVVCQKGHNTRLVYEERSATGDVTFINPCPGLVVDARDGASSIVSASINEFYLNSHAAIQGTAKPCKYSLIYDEIGWKVSELELLTYWSTYLYARCNKSVSYATPAYYAHWASKRCRELGTAGATAEDLLEISNIWTRPEAPSTMFFI